MTTSPQPESPEPLKVVAYRYVPSDVWRKVVLTEAPAKASLAKELGRTVDELVLKSDATAAIQAARNEAEAMRADPTRHEFTEEQCIDLFAAALYISARGDETSVLNEENAERIAKLLCDLAGVDLDAMKGDAQ